MGKTRDTANLISDGNITVDITNDRIGIGSTTPVSQLNVRTGPVVIGAATSTGTASQPLQVTGGAYVSGSVGFGVTLPNAKLEINNGTSADAGPEIRVGGNGYIDFHNTLSAGAYNPITTLNDKGIIFTDGTIGTGNLVIAPWSNSTGGIRINNNGEVLFSTTTRTGTASQPLQVTGGAYVSGAVGLGTTNPTQELHVQGDMRVTGGIYDSNNNVGTASSVLTSTGSGVQWTASATGTDITSCLFT